MNDRFSQKKPTLKTNEDGDYYDTDSSLFDALKNIQSGGRSLSVGCPCPRDRKCECDFGAVKPAEKPLTHCP